MPKVLLPTNHEYHVTRSMVKGYMDLGWDVALGVLNLRSKSANYDVVHLQWPEEFSDWHRPPTSHELAELRSCLSWWRERSKIVMTVHNLHPHVGDHPAFRDLYALFYEHAQIITHYSEFSRRAVTEMYPIAASARHVVHSVDSYEATLAIQRQRGNRRIDLGAQDDNFVILIMGQLRSVHELELIRKGYTAAKIPGKRLLMAARWGGHETGFKKRLIVAAWSRWIKSSDIIIRNEFLPEEELSILIDSCDVILVPRLTGLNSALIFAGMAFGRLIIAPNSESYADQLRQTRNLMYRAGDSRDLAKALELASKLDVNEIGAENARIASEGLWRDILTRCLQ